MTGKQTGLGDNFYVGGYDLSGDVSAIDTISSPVQLLDQTTLTYRAAQRALGRRDAAMSFTTFLDVNNPTIVNPVVPGDGIGYKSTYLYTVYVTITGGTWRAAGVNINGTQAGAGAGTYALPPLGTITLNYTLAPTWNWFARGTSHDALAPLPTDDVISSYFQGVAPGPSVGQPAASMVAKQVDYNMTRDDNANLTIKTAMQSNGYALEWGIQLTSGMRTDNGPVTGNAFDLGAPAGAYGGQAYLHLIQLVGTNVQVKIQQGDTEGGAYADLIDFGSKTVIGAWRASVSNTTATKRWYKVVSSGTFTQAVFAVNFIRNSIPGVQF